MPFSLEESLRDSSCYNKMRPAAAGKEEVMKILVINCGSSSLKYQLIDSDTEAFWRRDCARGSASTEANIAHQPAGGEKVKEMADMPDHTAAVKLVIEKLTDPKVGVIGSLSEIDAVGHRVVHGGESFSGSVLVDDEVIKGIEGLQRSCAAAQSGQPDRHPLLPGDHARRAHGGGVRYGVPSDHAGKGLSVRPSL